MRVSRDNGVCVQHGDTQIHLDASRIVRDGVTCISHAHADHVRNHYSDLILTPYTSALYPFKRARHKTMPYGVSFDYDGMWVSLHNANHILGSSQFMIEDGSTMVYTGDFRLKESLLGRCEPLECDTLVIEATFGLPEYVFPEPADVYDSIASWTKTSLASGRNVLFGAYALGKSQEIIRVLNQEGITPVVHPKIADFARVYNENGFHLKFVSSLTPEGGAMLSDQFAAIMPTSLMDGRFAHALKFASVLEYVEWAKSDARPGDIPASPSNVYKNKGWQGWYNWLGKQKKNKGKPS